MGSQMGMLHLYLNVRELGLLHLRDGALGIVAAAHVTAGCPARLSGSTRTFHA